MEAPDPQGACGLGTLLLLAGRVSYVLVWGAYLAASLELEGGYFKGRERGPVLLCTHVFVRMDK